MKSEPAEIGRTFYRDGSLEYLGQTRPKSNGQEREGWGETFYQSGALAHNGSYKGENTTSDEEMRM